MKDELGGKITTEVVGLRRKTYSYLLDDDTKIKMAKGTKNKYNNTGLSLIIAKKKKKNCLLRNKTASKLQQRFKSEKQNVYTEEVNKVA